MKYIITVKNLVKPDIGIKVIRYPSNDLTPQPPTYAIILARGGK